MAPSKPNAKQVATAYFEAVAARDVDAMMEHWEPGGMGHIYGMAELRAPDGYREYFGAMFRTVPDLSMSVLDMVAYGDKAAVRWGASGTFSGPGKFEGLAATGASVYIEGIDMLTIRDGLIRENFAYTNATELARQFGAAPAAGSFAERAMLSAVNARTAATSLLKRATSRASSS